MPRTAEGDTAPERLDAEARREALLDVALALVTEGGNGAVSMGTVAERAAVTRALVYKHFANREDMLAALYRREASALDRAIRRTVTAAPDGLEPKLRAFVHAVLEAVGTHRQVFDPLRSFRQDPTYRREQRSWDRRTVRFFAELASTELGVGEDVAAPAVGILLAGVDSLIVQARANRNPGHRQVLEDLFVEMAMTALAGLAARRSPGR
jgi:AcrR family transcriptional regulator